MTQGFYPEGRLITTPENRAACSTPAALRRAMEQGTILEGTALLCDAERNLHVSVGPYVGRIPRAETALGLVEGQIKEIAVLSRVGRPVCFTVEELHEENGILIPILSRRNAQIRAAEWLDLLDPGTILPATVTHLEHFGAFVDISCGLISMIGIERISVARIAHPRERFAPGQHIWSVLLGHDRANRRLLLSHRELLGTWAENIRPFSAGMTVPGIVRGLPNYGVFIELTPNLSGLAEPREDLVLGQRVSVYIKSILPERCKCKLLVIDTLPPAPPVKLNYYLPENGTLNQWQYAHLDPGKPEPLFSRRLTFTSFEDTSALDEN